MKIQKYMFLICALIMLNFSSCVDVFDKENLNAVNPDDVWNDEGLATAYVNNLYSLFMPGMVLNNGSASDEAPNGDGSTMNALLKGAADNNTVNYWPYQSIRKINILLEEIGTGNLSTEIQNKLKGEALFFRAWAYFNMTKLYGGVPLVLEVQDITDTNLSVSRSNAEECFAQVVNDLDDAIALLPNESLGNDYGRIDQGAAMAFKGRVLLFAASPQFNPSNNLDKWTSAYNANKEAIEFLKTKSKGLFTGGFANIWYQEQNEEVIMVHQYFNPGHTHNQAVIRPLWATQGSHGGDQPSLTLVNAFPLKDGSPFDPANGYGDYYQNRDDRFYATVAYNGSQNYDIQDLVDIESHLWVYHNSDTGVDAEVAFYGIGGSITGFFRAKAVDKKITDAQIGEADIDWIEIRYAEVLMNFGEAANEIGNKEEALQVLYDIRDRAGIEAGTGNYGVTASNQEEIREAYIQERFVEFAFEGKRWDDIRRWRRFDILNEQGVHQGLRLTLKSGEPAPSGYDNIDDFWQGFTWQIFDIETAPGEEINIPDTYYFYGIPEDYITKDINLEQTIGWDGGTFDPLK